MPASGWHCQCTLSEEQSSELWTWTESESIFLTNWIFYYTTVTYALLEWLNWLGRRRLRGFRLVSVILSLVPSVTHTKVGTKRVVGKEDKPSRANSVEVGSWKPSSEHIGFAEVKRWSVEQDSIPRLKGQANLKNCFCFSDKELGIDGFPGRYL